MKSLSVVIISYNEEQNIQGCLESARWADEIVVVDAFSTDNTPEICKEYTNKIYQRPWPGYGPQKNFGIRHASGDWIFVLDADERITPDLKQEVLDVLAHPGPEPVAAYEVPRRNHFFGQWVKRAGQYPDYQLRLIKNGKACYNDKKLHENLIVEGPISKLKYPLDHYSYYSVGDWLGKMNRYTSLMAEEQDNPKKRVNAAALFFRPLGIFIKFYWLKRGYGEGIRGVIISVFASFFAFMKYAKIWEKRCGR